MNPCCSMWCACRFPRPAASRKRWTALEAAAPGAAALIVEPLILGSGGMLIYSAGCAARDGGDLPQTRHAVYRR